MQKRERAENRLTKCSPPLCVDLHRSAGIRGLILTAGRAFLSYRHIDTQNSVTSTPFGDRRFIKVHLTVSVTFSLHSLARLCACRSVEVPAARA